MLTKPFPLILLRSPQKSSCGRKTYRYNNSVKFIQLLVNWKLHWTSARFFACRVSSFKTTQLWLVLIIFSTLVIDEQIRTSSWICFYLSYVFQLIFVLTVWDYQHRLGVTGDWKLRCVAAKEIGKSIQAHRRVHVELLTGQSRELSQVRCYSKKT